MATPAPTTPTPATGGETAPNESSRQDLSGLELVKQAYKETQPAPTDSKDEFFKIAKLYQQPAGSQTQPEQEQGPATDMLPPEIREQVGNVYYQIGETFQQVGVDVTPDDPEWKLIQAEIEDESGSLSRTLLAAEEAASKKKQRLNSMSSQDLWRTGNLFKK
jgi:hypothetical protein